jgi:Leucine Rich Repeat
LKKLGFVDCGLNVDENEAIIQAMLQGGNDFFRNLQVLSCTHNDDLETHALRWFSALGPAHFPCLEHLDLSKNPGSLTDKHVVDLFVQHVVSPSQGTAVLKDLNLSYCSDKNQGHPTHPGAGQ